MNREGVPPGSVVRSFLYSKILLGARGREVFNYKFTVNRWLPLDARPGLMAYCIGACAINGSGK